MNKNIDWKSINSFNDLVTVLYHYFKKELNEDNWQEIFKNVSENCDIDDYIKGLNLYFKEFAEEFEFSYSFSDFDQAYTNILINTIDVPYDKVIKLFQPMNFLKRPRICPVIALPDKDFTFDMSDPDDVYAYYPPLFINYENKKSKTVKLTGEKAYTWINGMEIENLILDAEVCELHSGLMQNPYFANLEITSNVKKLTIKKLAEEDIHTPINNPKLIINNSQLQLDDFTKNYLEKMFEV